MGTAHEKLNHLCDAKEEIRAAIEEKGVSIPKEELITTYPEKIRKIVSGEMITKAFLPNDFKGSTALGTTILINPKSYYSAIHSGGEYTWSITRISGSNSSTNSLLRINDHVLSQCDGNENRLAIKGEDGNFQNERFISSYASNFMPYILKNTVMIQCRSGNSYGLKMYRVSDSELVEVFSSFSLSSPSYFNATFFVLINPADEEHFYVIVNAYLFYKINKNTLECVQLNNVRLQSPMAYLKDGYIYNTNSSSNIGYKMDLATDTKTTYTVEHYNNISASKLMGLMDGSLWFYMNVSEGNIFTVYKPVLTAAEDGYEFIEDEEKSTMLRNVLGVITDNCIIEPQINNDIYIHNGINVFAFHYDRETETLTQIEHPCAKFEVPEGYWLLKSTVNMVDGWCAANYSNYSTGMITKYAKLEQTDLGELEWIAYEPVKANYIPQSITTISTGTTGTDEKGNNYLEVKRLKESNDLGDHLPGPQDPSHETETGGDKESSLN